MLTRTFSFWRRLVGKESGDPTRADRRLWVRYDSDIQASVGLEIGAKSVGLPARVRNISLGGASLVVDRPFETGHILTLDLPGREGEDANTVVACVVRVSSEKPGEWVLGCVFARELSEDDLHDLGVRCEQAQPQDQRRWVRFDCHVAAQFQKVGEPTEHTWKAQVINVSPSGIGLGVKEPISAGTLLSLELFRHDGQLLKSLLACVVHVTHQATEGWALGCNFIRELSDADLQALL